MSGKNRYVTYKKPESKILKAMKTCGKTLAEVGLGIASAASLLYSAFAAQGANSWLGLGMGAAFAFAGYCVARGENKGPRPNQFCPAGPR